MKRLILILTVMMFINIITTTAQTNQIQVTVAGLSCPVCTYGLEKKLKTIDGIENIKIDLEHGLVTFNMKDGKKITEAEVKKKVIDAGYTFKEMKYIEIPKK